MDNQAESQEADTGTVETQATEPAPERKRRMGRKAVQVPGDTATDDPQVDIVDETPPGLPSPDSVDADKIVRAVLTSEGWIVPTGKALPVSRM